MEQGEFKKGLQGLLMLLIPPGASGQRVRCQREALRTIDEALTIGEPSLDKSFAPKNVPMGLSEPLLVSYNGCMEKKVSFTSKI